ncbi:chromate resistance protein [soil metagenome]
MRWIALSYSLPAESTSSRRVALWRRVRRLGAVSLSGGFYLLPANEETVESFRWLAEEIRAAGGAAFALRVEGFEDDGERDVIDLVQRARDEEYADIASRAVDLGNAAREADADDRPAIGEHLDKLRKRFAEARRIDFFHAPAGKGAASAIDRAAAALSDRPAEREEIAPVDAGAYRGRTWVTRPRPHVDRLACAWLIRRFIDPDAEIRYAEKPDAGQVSFDMRGAEFGHSGPVCTFETMVEAFRLGDPALTIIKEIVHEIDLRDGASARPETVGIDSILNGWRASDIPDADLEQHGIALFEGLYRTLAGLEGAGRPGSIEQPAIKSKGGAG